MKSKATASIIKEIVNNKKLKLKERGITEEEVYRLIEFYFKYIAYVISKGLFCNVRVPGLGLFTLTGDYMGKYLIDGEKPKKMNYITYMRIRVNEYVYDEYKDGKWTRINTYKGQDFEV